MKPTALRVLAGLGFTDRMIRSPYSRLSGGWRSRAALAMGLIVPSDVLLLDEPSNFMASRHEAFTFRFGWLTGPQDLQALLYLEQLLANPSDPTQTLVLTSHDRAFLDNVAEETILLRNSQLDYAVELRRRWETWKRKLNAQRGKSGTPCRRSESTCVVTLYFLPSLTMKGRLRRVSAKDAGRRRNQGMRTGQLDGATCRVQS